LVSPTYLKTPVILPRRILCAARGVLYNESMTPVERKFPKSYEDAEIQTFCPTRICLGHHVFDGLFDSMEGDYGGFYVLTDDLLRSQRQEESWGLLQSADEAEVVFHHPLRDLAIPCRVQGCWVDSDGLLAYVRVKFPNGDEPTRRQLDHWIAMLW
jgi:hypothetical protein